MTGRVGLIGSFWPVGSLVFSSMAGVPLVWVSLSFALTGSLVDG